MDFSHDSFTYELTKRIITNTQSIEDLRGLALNILAQNKSQRDLLDLWISGETEQMKLSREAK